ncbi:hypothetical protein RISK_003889 [Rhodopirellula islandica]|uniref:Uncharacterized protein n=1 Tax=Rhodopirellula islandica TaxID=595434 RepID=A0A0J1BCL6_RHOIS|nr:hypothetical protein RISK_003889 [Rhodopirellula islandica]
MCFRHQCRNVSSLNECDAIGNECKFFAGAGTLVPIVRDVPFSDW